MPSSILTSLIDHYLGAGVGVVAIRGGVVHMTEQVLGGMHGARTERDASEQPTDIESLDSEDKTIDI